jgi:hypothetical protein
MPPFTPYLSSPPSLYNFQPLNSIAHQIRHSFAALTTSPSFTLSTPCSFTLVLAKARTTHVALQYETDGGKENGDGLE